MICFTIMMNISNINSNENVSLKTLLQQHEDSNIKISYRVINELTEEIYIPILPIIMTKYYNPESRVFNYYPTDRDAYNFVVFIPDSLKNCQLNIENLDYPDIQFYPYFFNILPNDSITFRVLLINASKCFSFADIENYIYDSKISYITESDRIKLWYELGPIIMNQELYIQQDNRNTFISDSSIALTDFSCKYYFKCSSIEMTLDQMRILFKYFEKNVKNSNLIIIE